MAQATIQHEKGSTVTSPGGGAAAASNNAFVQLYKDSPKPTSLASLPPTTLAAAARALHPGAAVVAGRATGPYMNPFSPGGGATAVASPSLPGPFSSLPFMPSSMAAAAAAAGGHHHASLAEMTMMQQRMAMDEQVRLRFMAQVALLTNRAGDAGAARGNFFGLGMMQQQQQQQQQQQAVALQQQQQQHQHQQQQVAILQQQQQQATALHQKRRLMEAQQLLQLPTSKRKKLSSQTPYRTSLLIKQSSSQSKTSSFPLPQWQERTTTRRLPVISSLQAYRDLWKRLEGVAIKSEAGTEEKKAFICHRFAKALENPSLFKQHDVAEKAKNVENDVKTKKSNPDESVSESDSDDENDDTDEGDETLTS